MLIYRIQPVAIALRLPLSLGGDLMMALEGIKAVAPKRVEESAEILAVSVGLSSSLKRARQILGAIGSPVTEAWLSPEDLGKLEAAGFAREPIEKRVDGWVRLLDDDGMQELVTEKLRLRSPLVADLLVRQASGRLH
jgi:hypothetical protein